MMTLSFAILDTIAVNIDKLAYALEPPFSLCRLVLLEVSFRDLEDISSPGFPRVLEGLAKRVDRSCTIVVYSSPKTTETGFDIM